MASTEILGDVEGAVLENGLAGSNDYIVDRGGERRIFKKEV